MITKKLFSHQLLFGLYFASLFSGVGIVLPFFPRWLEGQGLSAEEVGLVLGAAFVGKVVIGPVFATLADMTGTRKIWLFLISAAFFACVLGLNWAEGFWLIFLLWAVGGSLSTTQIPLSDSLSVMAVRRGTLDYGKARLCGSLGFIAVSFLSGRYLEGRGTDPILTLLILFTGLGMAATLLLPNLRAGSRGRATKSLWEAFKLTDFRLFVVIAALVQSSHAALYGFATLHWKASGLSEAEIGMLWAEGVVIEVLVFAFGRRLLLKLDIIGLIALAITGGCVRWIVLGATADLAWLAVIQMLHACTFAATHLSVVTYIARRIPEHLSASAQGLYDLLAMGIFFAVAIWLAGIVYENYQGRTFWVMAGFTLLAGVLLLLNLRRIRNGSVEVVEAVL